MRAYWSRIVTTSFGAGLLFALFTARFYDIQVGWEIWWQDIQREGQWRIQRNLRVGYLDYYLMPKENSV